MNVYDGAHALARELKNCPEVIEYRAAYKKVDANKVNKKMLDDFERMRLEAYTQQMKNGKISKESEEKLNDLGSIISMNPDVSAYIQAEQRFYVIWEDILKILKDAVDVDLTFGLYKE